MRVASAGEKRKLELSWAFEVRRPRGRRLLRADRKLGSAQPSSFGPEEALGAFVYRYSSAAKSTKWVTAKAMVAAAPSAMTPRPPSPRRLRPGPPIMTRRAPTLPSLQLALVCIFSLSTLSLSFDFLTDWTVSRAYFSTVRSSADSYYLQARKCVCALVLVIIYDWRRKIRSVDIRYAPKHWWPNHWYRGNEAFKFSWHVNKRSWGLLTWKLINRVHFRTFLYPSNAESDRLVQFNRFFSIITCAFINYRFCLWILGEHSCYSYWKQRLTWFLNKLKQLFVLHFVLLRY